jgi:hypothetical protein
MQVPRLPGIRLSPRPLPEPGSERQIIMLEVLGRYPSGDPSGCCCSNTGSDNQLSGTPSVTKCNELLPIVCEDERSRSEANPAMGARDSRAVWGSCVARSGWSLESWKSAVTPVPLLANLLLNRHAGVRRRLRLIRLFGCRFGRWLEEVACKVVNYALLADMATTRGFSGHGDTL